MIKLVYVIDCLSNELSKEFKKAIREAWSDFEFGNDWFYLPGDYIAERMDDGSWVAIEESYKPLLDFMMKQNLNPEHVLFHYWW